MAVPHESEIAKNEAEAESYLAEAKKLNAEARQAVAEAKLAELKLREAQRKERDELAKNVHHRVYVFDSMVSESTVKACIQQLTTWSRQDPKCEIEIQINSPGGGIFEGFALIDFIRGLRDRGHKVTMVALGMAASMGGVILQAADERIMGANALILIHEGSLGAVGDFGAVEDRVKLMGMFHERILSLFEERAKPINPKTTKAFIRKNWSRRDWWIDSAEAMKLGLVDAVR